MQVQMERRANLKGGAGNGEIADSLDVGFGAHVFGLSRRA
jgi:hypothetical protein